MISYALDYSPHGFVGDIMQTSKANHAHIQGGKLLAELFRLGIGKARSWAFLAFEILQGWVACTAFRPHIASVVALSAKKKVRRIATSGIVAGWAIMTNIHAVWDWAVDKKVSKSRCSPADALVMELPIAMDTDGSLPQPTVIRAAPIYFFPESFLGGTRASNLVVMSEDEPNGLSLDVTLSADIGFRYGSRMAAATFAKLLGIVRGIMGLHKKLAFLVPSLGTFRDVAGALSIGFYRSNCTTKCVLLKVIGGTMVSFVAVSESPDRQ